MDALTKRIAYDPELRRPGCVLIQAMLGGCSTEDLMTHFDDCDWILGPTPGMDVYRVTDEQLAKLGEITRKARK